MYELARKKDCSRNAIEVRLVLVRPTVSVSHCLRTYRSPLTGREANVTIETWY